MKKIIIDCSRYSSKQKLLQFLTAQIEGLYGENYDALIDALTFFQTPLLITFKNFEKYSDKENLLPVLDIISNDNPQISFIK